MWSGRALHRSDPVEGKLRPADIFGPVRLPNCEMHFFTFFFYSALANFIDIHFIKCNSFRTGQSVTL